MQTLSSKHKSEGLLRAKPLKTVQEKWEPIPNWEGYYSVSNLGRVRSHDRVVMRSNGRRQFWAGKIMSGRPTGSGHHKVQLRMNGYYEEHLIHRLVMLVFVGPCPEGQEVCHKNGNGVDNRLSNLRYGTRSQNQLDRVRHGTHQWAARTHCTRGHEYTPENIYWRPNPKGKPKRSCRKCTKERLRLRYLASKETIKG